MIQPDDFGELFIRVLEKKTKSTRRRMGRGRRGRMIKCIHKSKIRYYKAAQMEKRALSSVSKYGLK